MTDAVTSQTLVDNDRRAVVKLTNISDGTGEAAVTKVDVSGLGANGDGTACTSVTIERIQYDVSGMVVHVLWDATADAVCATLSNAATLCFKDMGGLKNNAGAGKTGDVNFTTVGHTSGDTYTVVLSLLKNYD